MNVDAKLRNRMADGAGWAVWPGYFRVATSLAERACAVELCWREAPGCRQPRSSTAVVPLIGSMDKETGR